MPPSSGVRIAVAGEDQAHRALVAFRGALRGTLVPLFIPGLAGR